MSMPKPIILWIEMYQGELKVTWTPNSLSPTMPSVFLKLMDEEDTFSMDIPDLPWGTWANIPSPSQPWISRPREGFGKSSHVSRIWFSTCEEKYLPKSWFFSEWIYLRNWNKSECMYFSWVFSWVDAFAFNEFFPHEHVEHGMVKLQTRPGWRRPVATTSFTMVRRRRLSWRQRGAGSGQYGSIWYVCVEDII